MTGQCHTLVALPYGLRLLYQLNRGLCRHNIGFHALRKKKFCFCVESKYDTVVRPIAYYTMPTTISWARLFITVFIKARIFSSVNNLVQKIMSYSDAECTSVLKNCMYKFLSLIKYNGHSKSAQFRDKRCFGHGILSFFFPQNYSHAELLLSTV